MSSLTKRYVVCLVTGLALGSVATDARSLMSLSNEPLFVTVPVKPNVMLTIDDSGSMDSEVLMPSNDGALWWHTGNQSFVGLGRNDAASPGTINYNEAGTAGNSWKKYVYLFPIGTGTGKRVYGDSTHDHYAVPPVAEYAYLRSSEYNKAFYDPTKAYAPWPSSYGQTFSDAEPTAAATDPVRGSDTLNLTQVITDSGGNHTFRLQPGMRDAAGNLVEDDPENGVFSYYPATYYTVYDGGGCSAPDPADYVTFLLDTTIVPTGVDAIAPDGKCLVKHVITAGTTEMENFANWFTYHRKRHLSMRGGILSAFEDVSGIRTGLFSFNSRPSTVSMLDFDTDKSSFFNTLKNMVGSGGTPTRESLNHCGAQFERTDGSAPITFYCQKNFTIVFTDGFAVPSSISGIGNEDGPLSSSRPSPYADDYSDTLGDIAMEYYRENLRSGLTTGGVPVSNACHRPSPDPLLDCNQDLHMVTYGVGLGVQGTIFGVTHNTTADAHTTPPVWPDPSVSRNPVQVDDLYHATVNGRGDFLNAATPDEISGKMGQVLSSILDEISSASSVAANSTSLMLGTKVFQAKFHSATWHGQLLAYGIDLNGNISPLFTWDAGALLDAMSPSSRKIVTISRDTQDGIPFTWSSITGQSDNVQENFLNMDAAGVSGSLGSSRVDYLRGADVTGFRDRTNLLGDIVQSSPINVGPPQAGHLDSTYATFAAGKSARTLVIYVGANDGMLHGFNANTGAEEIAYVPGPVYRNLSRLTDPNYGQTILPHHYYVDGSPIVADAKLGTNWKTVLAGGLNKGGQGYYALDITDPSSFSQANAASLVLWEFTDEIDADLGYTYNQPQTNYDTQQSAQIAKMNNGKWALIVGNGYNNTEPDGSASATGHAVLFILFLEDGADGTWSTGDYVKIDTGAGSVANPNGLATPTPVDLDGDGDVDTVYAGDLEGNLWKFNLTSASANSWTVGKLYAAVDAGGNAQPITTAPMAAPHPAGGFIVSFGTGQYLEFADLSTTDPHTLYGVWDVQLGGSVTIVTGGRTDLVEQTVLGVTTVTGLDYRLTSDNTVDYGTKKGWYMDLPTSGERVAYNPIPRDRRFVFVTLIPDPTGDPCLAGGNGWVMELDYLDGSRLPEPPFDINGDTAVDDLDHVTVTTNGVTEQVTVSGIQPPIGIPTTPTVIGKDRETEVKVISGSTGSMFTLIEGRSMKTGRLSWKQLIEN